MKFLIKIFLIAVVFYFVYLFLAIYWTGYVKNDLKPAQAVVVLGAAQYDGVPSPIFASRLDHAQNLYNLGLAEKIIITGGKGGKSDIYSEGRAGRDYLAKKGVAADDLLFEEKSRTTVENIIELKKILKVEKIQSVIFVSDRFHMFRIAQIAKREKLSFQLSPTDTSPLEKNSGRELEFVWREMQIYFKYLLFGI